MSSRERSTIREGQGRQTNSLCQALSEQSENKTRATWERGSLPSPRAFFAFLFTERLFTTISEPGTGQQTNKKYFRLTNLLIVKIKMGGTEQFTRRNKEHRKAVDSFLK